MRCHHYCNCPMSCPECIRRFYKWAQSHTYGRKGAAGPHFYDNVSTPQKGPSHGMRVDATPGAIAHGADK